MQPFLLFLLLFAVAYSPVWCFDYLFHDDGSFWVKAREYGFRHIFFDNIMSQCRYGNALLLQLEAFFVHKIVDLKILRSIGIVFMAINASFLWRLMRRYPFLEAQAFLIVSAMFLLPEFAAIIFYSISAAYFPLCIFLCCWAFYRLVNGQRIFLSALLLFAAITIYQPLGMFYWALTGMHILFSPDRSSPAYKKDTFRLMVAGFAGLLCYAVSVYIMHYFFSSKIGHSLYNPYVVSFDVVGKLRWFFQEPLANALNLWDIFPKLSTSLIVAGFILITALMVKFNKKISLFNFWQLAAFIVVFFLTFLPNLAARANAPFYRCLVPLASLIWLMVVWSIFQWAKIIPGILNARALTVLLSIIVTVGGIVTFLDVLDERVLPSSIEWNAYRDAAVQVRLRGMKAVHIIVPRHQFSKERYDEFGVLSSHYPFDLYQLTACAFNEIGKAGHGLPLLYFSYADDPMVIELNEIYVKLTGDGKWIGRDIDKDGQLAPINVSFSDNTMDHVLFPNYSTQPVSLKRKRWYVLDLNSYFSPLNYEDTSPDTKTELAKAYDNRASIYFQHGNLAQAAADYARSAMLAPGREDPYYNLAIIYYKAGARDLALVNISHALLINPSDKDATAIRSAIDQKL